MAALRFIATMLRIHLLQQWYSLSDPALGESLIEVPTMRRFVCIELISDRIPDETTILTFRHLLEKHDLGEQTFKTVKANLNTGGMTARQGTIIDATLIWECSRRPADQITKLHGQDKNRCRINMMVAFSNLFRSWRSTSCSMNTGLVCLLGLVGGKREGGKPVISFPGADSSLKAIEAHASRLLAAPRCSNRHRPEPPKCYLALTKIENY